MDSERWARFSPRDGDIVISTPEKSGTTWMQVICALLVFGRSSLDRSLDLISPCLDLQTRPVDDVVADLDAQQHRRFVKTHTPLDGLPDDPGITYVCVGRDPRDVGISWMHHQDNMDVRALFGARGRAIGNDDLADLLRGWRPPPADPVDRFFAWAEHDPPDDGLRHPCLASTMHHLTTVWDVRDRPNVVLVHYSDLRQDLDGEMRRLASWLDIAVDEARWPDLVAAAGFEAMRARADELAPDVTIGALRSNRAFFRSGTDGQWRELLDDSGRRRYAQRVARLAPTDLVEWVHRDPVDLGSTP
jgi:hypothetical protein